MPKVNLFPVSVIKSQTINHHGLRRVLTNKSRRSKQPLSNMSSEPNQKITIYRSYQIQRNKAKQVIWKAKMELKSSTILLLLLYILYSKYCQTSNLILNGCINILGKRKKLNILLVH